MSRAVWQIATAQPGLAVSNVLQYFKLPTRFTKDGSSKVIRSVCILRHHYTASKPTSGSSNEVKGNGKFRLSV